MRFLVRLIINTVALWAAIKLVPGITYTGSVPALVLVALVFGLVNASIGFLFRVVTFPLTCLTLGLFSLVVNALLFWLASALSTAMGLGYHVTGFWAAFLGAIVTAFTSMILTLMIRATQTEPGPP